MLRCHFGGSAVEEATGSCKSMALTFAIRVKKESNLSKDRAEMKC